MYVSLAKNRVACLSLAGNDFRILKFLFFRNSEFQLEKLEEFNLQSVKCVTGQVPDKRKNRMAENFMDELGV